MSYFFNLRYQWSIDPSINLGGVTFCASGLDMESFFRRETIENQTQEKIFDPQLYLIDLDPKNSPVACSRLSSFPWFPASCIEQAELGYREWMKQVKESIEDNWSPELPTDFEEIKERAFKCLEFQIQIGCSILVAPSTLIKNPSTSLDYEMQWIDASLDAYAEIGSDLPIYATLAISDLCLKEKKPFDNPFLELCFDQLSSRPELDGIYFVLERSTPGQKRLINLNTVESILTLAYIFTEKIGFDFFTNYCEEFGFITLGAGGTHFGSDDTVKGRRLHLQDFVERGGGTNYPYIFSLNNFSDFRPITDLQKISDIGFFNSLNIESTRFSNDLIEAIRNKRPVTVPEWQESLNNVGRAKNHYIECLKDQVDSIAEMNLNEKINYIHQMLISAEMRMNYLETRIKDDPLLEDGKHISNWREGFERFIENLEYF